MLKVFTFNFDLYWLYLLYIVAKSPQRNTLVSVRSKSGWMSSRMQTMSRAIRLTGSHLGGWKRGKSSSKTNLKSRSRFGIKWRKKSILLGHLWEGKSCWRHIWNSIGTPQNMMVVKLSGSLLYFCCFVWRRSILLSFFMSHQLYSWLPRLAFVTRKCLH